MRSRSLKPWFAAAVLLSLAAPCSAQILPWESAPWEFEVHGGGGFANNPATEGTANLPAPGAPFTTTIGTTSRKTSSWYFGDGAVLLNQVNAALGAGASITPLDTVLQSPLIRRPSSASAGLRLSRAISRRFAAEVTFDYSFAKWQLTTPALAGLEASRASFVSAFNAMIATAPFQAPTVTSSSSVSDRSGHQILTTGALNINFKTTGNVIPYATVGAGVNVNVGDTPSASLVGNYQFQILGFYPIKERDTVTVTSSVANKFVGVVGGGVKYFVSRRWGLRLDVRAYLSRRALTTSVSSSPGPSNGTQPQGTTATFTTPSVQFSNTVALGPSTLSGVGAFGFPTFSGSSMQSVVNVTAGVILRFR
jgi:hypothetical protein